MTKYVDFNQDRWNRVSSRQGNPYTIPLSHEKFEHAKANSLTVALTVGKTVPLNWLTGLKRLEEKNYWD